MKKGDILGYYYGEMYRGEAWDDTNQYNLKLEHMDDEGGAYVDGTPGVVLDEYRLSLINGDYTETMSMQNCGIDKYGRIVMTKNTRKGKDLIMHYGLDEKGNSSYNWGKLDENLIHLAIKKTIELGSILSTEEINQLKIADVTKNDIYQKVKKMVLDNEKSKIRHKKPDNQEINETLDFLYSMAIYRDWVVKQKTEEGIKRQSLITSKDIEAEVRMIRGMRSSKRLQGNAVDVEVELDSSEARKEYDKQVETGRISISNQVMPKCVQKFFLGVLNINILTESKLEDIMKMYVKDEYDIIALVDTRVTRRDESGLNAIIRKYQRRGDYHKYFDIKENVEGPGAKKVGGMLFLMSSRCGILVNTYELGEGIGVYSEVTHKIGALTLTTSATYWPNKKAGKNGEASLNNQIRKYLDAKKIMSNEPLEYIKMECSERIKRAERLGQAYIIMGDMNQSWESNNGSGEGIKGWAKENNLTSSRQSGDSYSMRNTRYANIHKRKGGTEIDHVLTNEILIPLQDKEGYDENHAHDRLSDHIMQIILINVPLMPRIKRAKEKKKAREVIDVKITKEKYIEGEEIKYTGKALKWKMRIEKEYIKGKKKLLKDGESATEKLRKISSWIYDNTYKNFNIGNNYWSMETAVLDTYERTMYKLQRLLIIKTVHASSKIKK